MITPEYVATMARYNAWQNGSIIAAADTLDDAARRQPRGAFFGSIHATLSHLLWGDRTWMSRFDGTPPPRMTSFADSVIEIESWDEYRPARKAMDNAILDWASRIDAARLGATLSWYSGVFKRDMTRPIAPLIVHFFNHQTHHRGQVHALLTSLGANTDDTDLFLMPSPDASI